MARNIQTKGMTNKRMNEDVYKERRIVIDLIYKAKNLLRQNGIEMSRINVRITTPTTSNACGVARMNGNIIWIPSTTLNKHYLYQTVLHELCHTIWGIEHNSKCKLMSATVEIDLSNNDAEKIFIEYAKKHMKS